MNNSKERTGLNRMKRFFCLMMVVMLAVSMLPATGLASSDIQIVRSNWLELYGTLEDDALEVDSGYRFDVKNESAKWFMRLTDKNGKVLTTLDLDPDSAQRSVSWKGLTVTRVNAEDSWVGNMYVIFNVVDSNKETNITSVNVQPLSSSITTRDITKNKTITPTFKIVDVNIKADDVNNGKFSIIEGPVGAFIHLPDVNNTKTELKKIDSDNGDLTLSVTLPLRYTGKGKDLYFKIAYTTDNGIKRIIDCTATIPYTVEYVEDKDDDDDDDPADTLIPYIIVDSYAYGGTSVTAGEEFTLTLRLRNTSTTHSLENIVMNVSPMGVFSMTSSSNTFYINKLQAGSILERTVTLKAGLTKVTDDEDANSINMKFTYQYMGKDDKTLQTGNSSESITLPVDFPDRFELGIPESDDMAFAGEDFYLTVPMVNKGRSSVYNLTAFVRGDGLKNPGQTQYIGNLNAGTESSADFSLQYLEPGDYSGEIVVTYEDANMNPKELIAVFNVTVEDMWGGGPMEPEWPGGFDPDIPAEPTDAKPENDPVRPVKIAVALVVCAMSAYVTIQKAKAKRSIYLDEDL